MIATFAEVNGIRIAYRIQGAGPPLGIVTGYRLSSAAWPPAFVEALARKFTVVTLDNRGTGLSDKPVHGYAIANLARDIQACSTNSRFRASICWAIQWAALLRRICSAIPRTGSNPDAVRDDGGKYAQLTPNRPSPA